MREFNISIDDFIKSYKIEPSEDIGKIISEEKSFRRSSLKELERNPQRHYLTVVVVVEKRKKVELSYQVLDTYTTEHKISIRVSDHVPEESSEYKIATILLSCFKVNEIDEIKKTYLSSVNKLYQNNSLFKYSENFQEFFFFAIQSKKKYDDFWRISTLKKVKVPKQAMNICTSLGIWNFTELQFHKNSFHMTSEEHKKQCYNGGRIEIAFIEGTKLTVGGNGRHRPFIANYFDDITPNILHEIKVSPYMYSDFIEEHYLVERDSDLSVLELFVAVKKLEYQKAFYKKYIFSKLVEFDLLEEKNMHSYQMYCFIQLVSMEIKLLIDSGFIELVNMSQKLDIEISDGRNKFPFSYLKSAKLIKSFKTNEEQLTEYFNYCCELIKLYEYIHWCKVIKFYEKAYINEELIYFGCN